MVKLIIFDLDGVLVNARELHYEALNKALGSIDEKYIISLAKKKFLYYSADVIQNEQFVKKKDYIQLNKMSNIFITKHIAGLTKESIYKTDKKIFSDFIKFYEKN